jgi:hypothetical protein
MMISNKDKISCLSYIEIENSNEYKNQLLDLYINLS